MTANDQELASINRLAGNYAMVRNPRGVQNRYTNLHDMGRIQRFTTQEVDAIIASGFSGKKIGAAIGNAMNKMVLDRLLPRVI